MKAYEGSANISVQREDHAYLRVFLIRRAIFFFLQNATQVYSTQVFDEVNTSKLI
jgi:hypothetical protein